MFFAIARSSSAALRRSSTRIALRTPVHRFAPLYLRTMATSSSLLEVGREIKLDHDNVRDLFDRYKAASGHDEKVALANTLIREMAVHSDAESTASATPPRTIRLRTRDSEEHAEVKKLVYGADATSFSKPEYDELLSRAVTGFLSYAKEEEDDQLPQLRNNLTPEQSDKLARDFLKARKMVSSRPHPMAPQTGGIAQKAAGARGKLHDKVLAWIMESLEGRKFVGVKYSHPEI
ncbi:hypothetical protein CERSUDRAFT_93778 [Gelatoporia subvermispora B]|uniref:Hemerythrin-like domain-containing protein n=1 Tax=Ceriporiopsis subvermispora (strain B) TaxID=914234 RepID=M2RHE7_CERS8|nr:hypothetical protein CERSUDRAFT_93778 [Gelatoporia subvermispora B]